jgi:uncharacterized ion transporter superfamily protein YfcC
MIYRIIVFLVILIAAITYIVISSRKYRRLLKAEMEEINRKERSRMRNWTAEDYRKYDYVMSIHRSQMERVRVDRGIPRWTVVDSRIQITDTEKKIEPYKHIKRHSIR